jgi:hypothetical protein
MVPNTRYFMSRCLSLTQARFQSMNLHFYQNRQLELYASKEAQRLSLRQLVHNLLPEKIFLRAVAHFQVFYGRFMSEERLIKVCFVLTLLSSINHAFRAQTMSERSFLCAWHTEYGTCRLFHMLSLCKRVLQKCMR